MAYDGFEGDVPALVAAFNREKRFLDTGDPAYGGNDIDIYGDYGLLLGIQTAACLAVLNRLGYRNCIRAATGCSTAAPPIYYWLYDQVVRSRSIYFRECITREFLHLRNLMSEKVDAYAMGVDFLMNVFLGSTGKGVEDVPRYATVTQGYAVVTDWETGEPEHLLLGRSIIDSVLKITASLADPVLSHGNIMIDGRRRCDGLVGAPFGISHVLTRKPKHLLILANGSEKQKLETKREYSPRIPAFKRLPDQIRAKLIAQPETVARELREARANKDCNIVFFWGPPGDAADRNSASVRNLGKTASQLFAAPFREHLANAAA